MIGPHQRPQAGGGERGPVSFPGEGAAHPADPVFDAPFLPRGMRATEKRLYAERMQLLVIRERGAIIKGDRAAQGRRQGGKQRRESGGHRLGPFVGCRLATNTRERRSCVTRTAWPYFANSIRSASQWPGSCRCWIVASRS